MNKEQGPPAPSLLPMTVDEEENQRSDFTLALMEVLFGMNMPLHALLHAKIRIFRGEEWLGTSIRHSPLLHLRMIQAGRCLYAVSLVE